VKTNAVIVLDTNFLIIAVFMKKLF